jgi:ribosome modulation factor
MIMTPYRRGYQAGLEHRSAMETWKAERQFIVPRPLEPACPYVVVRSVSAWKEGFRRASQLTK